MKRMKPCINSMWLLVTVLLVTALLGTAVNAETWKDIRDDIRMSNGNRALPKNHVLPQIVMNYTVTGFTGTPCEFPINPIQTTGLIVEIAWDFDADGQIDLRTKNVEETVKHQYPISGKYSAACYVYDDYGEVTCAYVQVSILPGYGQFKLEPRKMVFSSSPSKHSTSAPKDGRTYYLMMGSGLDRQWAPVRDAYYWAIDSFGIDSSLITVVAGNHDYDHWALDTLLDDTVIIDYGMEDSDSAYNHMIQLLTASDTLHIYQIGEGAGRYDSSVFLYGPDVVPFQRNCLTNSSIDPNDPDCNTLESDFLNCLNIEHGVRRNYRGLDQWAGSWTPGAIATTQVVWRSKIVSHFSNVTFDSTFSGGSDTTISDSDIFLEVFMQYLACDSNLNGREDEGEDWNLDSDSDDILAIDTTDSGYIFDEDEWGFLYLKSDGVDGSWGWFDSSLDNQVDVDPSYVYPTVGWQIRGTDYDNDGLIIGVDITEDGDFDDYVGSEERGTHGTDDELREFLDSLDYDLVTLHNSYCFGGGFIDDLSRDDVIIYTSTTDGTTGYDMMYTDFMTSVSDINGDSVVTFAEVINYNDVVSKNRLDDNGDGVGHGPTIPNGGDGTLAAQLGIGRLLMPEPPDPPTLVSTEGDTVNSLDADFTWSLVPEADFYEISYKLPDFPSLRGPNGWVTWGTYINDTTASLSLLDMSPLNKYSDIGHYWRVRGGLFGRDVDVYGDWSDSSSYYFLYDEVCCDGIRGNVDGDSAQIVDIGDLTYLGNYLNLMGPEPECRIEACITSDFMGYPDPVIDVGDLTFMINYLFQQGPPPPDCR